MASSAASSLVKQPFSTTSKTCSLTSTPTLFTLHSFLSIPSKPIKPFNISCSSSSLSSKSRNFPKINKLSLFNMVTHVAQFSEGAAVEEQTAEEVVAAQDPEGEGGIEEEDIEEEEEEEESSFADPPEEAKLFVGNLPYDVDSEALANLFNQAGVVEIAEVIYNRETGQSRGFGFVTMNTVEEAEAVVEKFNRYEINGRSLTVNRAAPRGSPRPEQTPRTFVASNRIYIGNLPWQADDARLEQVFSEHGKVIDARVVYDRETQRSRGFGFVTMSNETEVNDAIAALDGQTLDGRAIRVNVAEEKPRRSSF